MYRRESQEHRAAKLREEHAPEVHSRNSVPIPVDMPKIMNQTEPNANEQTFENMARYIAKTTDGDD